MLQREVAGGTGGFWSREGSLGPLAARRGSSRGGPDRRGSSAEGCVRCGERSGRAWLGRGSRRGSCRLFCAAGSPWRGPRSARCCGLGALWFGSSCRARAGRSRRRWPWGRGGSERVSRGGSARRGSPTCGAACGNGGWDGCCGGWETVVPSRFSRGPPPRRCRLRREVLPDGGGDPPPDPRSPEPSPEPSPAKSYGSSARRRIIIVSISRVGEALRSSSRIASSTI